MKKWGDRHVSAGPKAKTITEKIATIAENAKREDTYENKIVGAVLRTIVDISVDPKSDVTFLKASEICDALTTVVAGFLPPAKGVDSSAQLREQCRIYADKLHRRALLVQERAPLFPGYDPSKRH